MKIKVQAVPGLPAVIELEQVIKTHPEATASSTCRTCEPLEGKPVAQVGYPQFHPHCACEVVWSPVKES